MKLLNLSLIFLLSSFLSSCLGQTTKTLNERLGYSADAKLLIIHADDLGVSHSENIASFRAMEEGVVNSASIMVPCPWFPEVAEYAKNHPEADLGLHLTLTSEWKHYRWGPVTSYSEVQSLVNEQNFLHAGTEGVAKNAKPEDVKRELRAQVERAKAFGINPTHLDTHMGSLLGTPALFKAYLEVGREYKLPVLLAGGDFAGVPASYKEMITDEDILIDKIYTASPDDMKNGMAAYYTKVIKSLPAGVSTFLIHTAYENEEMKAVTIEHPDWGAVWRQADYDFFTSEAAKKLLKEENIQLVTWREIGKLLR